MILIPTHFLRTHAYSQAPMHCSLVELLYSNISFTPSGRNKNNYSNICLVLLSGIREFTLYCSKFNIMSQHIMPKIHAIIYPLSFPNFFIQPRIHNHLSTGTTGTLPYTHQSIFTKGNFLSLVPPLTWTYMHTQIRNIHVCAHIQTGTDTIASYNRVTFTINSSMKF